jgi:heme exporter protein CcmD
VNATPFIVIAYAVFAIFIIVDTVMPLLQRRQLLRDLKGRLQRQRKRNAS